VPPAVADIVMKLLEKNPEDRYQSATGLRADLERCLETLDREEELASFPLGTRDVSPELHLSEHLYGREAEIDALVGAFERAGMGRVELLLVGGYSGVGKSALVHEIHKPVTAARGRYAAGKFDQLVSTPYAALVQAIEELLQDVLTESAEVVERLRAALLAATGDDAGVLLDVVPELQLLLGSDVPPLAPLGPAEARARFQRVFQRFLHAFASEESPLVLFLDDLQWADVPSLELLQTLLLDPAGGHLLLLGAYRDNEVDEAHPLARTLATLSRAEAPVARLHLKPLGRDSVSRWLADSLGCGLEAVAALSREIHNKTRGNPFFVERFIQMLYEEEILTFDASAGRWRWELDSLRALGITENVADLMASRLARLPEGCRGALEVAACVGARFQLETLAQAMGEDVQDVAEALWPALGAGLLDPIGDAYRLVGLVEDAASEVAYRFVHDRIQEASYASIGEARRAESHLRIGRRLLAGADLEAPETLFAVADQLDAGRALITDREEQLRLAEINLAAGERAGASVAFQAARHYLEVGVELMGAAGWEERYRATFELHRALALANESCGDDEASIAILHAALDRAQEVGDKVRLLKIESEQYGRTGAHQQCMEVGLKALALLGYEIPGPPEAWVARGEAEAAALEEALAGREPPDLLDLPEMTDEKARLATEVLAVLSPVIWANPHTIPVINPWLVRTYIAHGHTDQSVPSYAGFAMQLSAFGQYARADGFGRLAAALADARGQRGAWPSVGFVNAMWVAHWCHPLSEAVAFGRKGIDAAVDTGAGYNWAAWAAMTMPGLHMAGASGLDEALEETRRHIRVSDTRFHVVDAVNICTCALLPMMRLSGDEAGVRAQLAAGQSEAELHRRLEHYPLIRGPLYAWRMAADYILGDYEATLLGLEQARETIVLGPGLISFLMWRFFGCLAMLARWELASEEERAHYGAFLDESLPMLEGWAATNPAVHGAKPLLLRAELARIHGDAAAPELYDGAVAAAEDGGSVRDQGLCLERAGRYWIAAGKPRRARGYLADARFAWVRWGAGGKVGALEREFAFLIPNEVVEGPRTRTRTGSHRTSDLDAQTLLQATRAISTELVLEDLLSTLLNKVIENAGAQRAALVLPDRRGELVIRAGASVTEEEAAGVPWSLVRYVARSRQRVVLGDAVRSERFGEDPHIASRRSRSALCQPILAQGELVGVLYLENNLAADAFTPQRCEVLDVLSAQAAISIQNARLFDEQRGLTQAMSRFLPREFLGLLRKESVVDVGLGDAIEQEMTVLFSDIRGFTSRSEAMTPSEIFRFLNSYLRHAGPVIRRHGGFIDKYIGDEVMALFPGDPSSAVRAAVDLMQALRVFNAELAAEGEEPMRVGVGLHLGRLMLGTIGEPERMDGTVISDTVNVASRLQGMTKVLAAPVIVSGAVLDRVPDMQTFPRRFLGEVQLRGRQRSLPIYEVFAADSPTSRAAKEATREDFEVGVRALNAGDTAGAIAAFQRVVDVNPEDASARYHLARARNPAGA
jgi:predicted ATPase/class 3 adenylate cyclase